MQFLDGFLCTLVSEKQTPKYEKSTNYIGKIICFPFRQLIVRSLLVHLTSELQQIDPYGVPEALRLVSRHSKDFGISDKVPESQNPEIRYSKNMIPSHDNQ